jgi:hypothetical protein
MHILFLPENLQGENYLEHLDVNDRIAVTLKPTSRKLGLQIWVEFVSVGIKYWERFT